MRDVCIEAQHVHRDICVDVVVLAVGVAACKTSTLRNDMSVFYFVEVDGEQHCKVARFDGGKGARETIHWEFISGYP